MTKPHFKKIVCHPLMLIIGVGLLLRLISWHNTHVVNLDAMVYIAQAKAIYFGHDDAILSDLPYLSPYSIFIAHAYRIIGDWIISATLISFFFGITTLFPLYAFLRQYFDKNHALFTTLIFTVLPVFVSRSVDIIKDPMYWFFLTTGLWLFTAQIGKMRYFPTFLSLACFAMASLIRVEAVLFIIVSFGFILFLRPYRKIKLMFTIFTLFLIYTFSKANFFADNLSANPFSRVDEIINLATHISSNYRDLRQNISHLAMGQDLTLKLFLMEAKRNLWLLAFEKLINSFLEGLAYLPGILFFMGIYSLKGFARDKKKAYCVILLVASFILLYLFTLTTWIMSYRYVALFIVPSMVVIGYGLSRCSDMAFNRWSIRKSTSIILILSIILTVSATKALKPRRAEQLPYKQAGILIAKDQGNDRAINIASDEISDSAKWISFYANLNYKGFLRLHERNNNITSIPYNNPNLIALLEQQHIKHCLINRDLWNDKNFKVLMEQQGETFTLIWDKQNPLPSNLFLLEIKKAI